MFKQQIEKLTKTLYPRGRAFNILPGSVKEKLHRALAESESKAFTDAKGVLDSILPDNPNFTIEDAENWERRLGLITNDFVTLSDRKLSIARKYNHPGTIPARQHFKYMEGQLQAAGFNVTITENRFPASVLIPEQMGVSEMASGTEMAGETTNPVKYEVIDPYALGAENLQMGLFEMGAGAEMGGYFQPGGFEVIANHIDPNKDADFFTDFLISEMGDNAQMGNIEMAGFVDYLDKLRFTFFVSALSFPNTALIPFDRKDEFRQLILKLKPANTVGFIYAEYSVDDFNDDFNNDFNNFEP